MLELSSALYRLYILTICSLTSRDIRDSVVLCVHVAHIAIQYEVFGCITDADHFVLGASEDLKGCFMNSPL